MDAAPVEDDDRMVEDLHADKVLLGAMHANLRSVTVVGTGVNGETYFASTHANCADTLWDLKTAEQILMDYASE